MYKEKQIIEKYPFNKAELVELRKERFKEGVDWIREPKVGGKPGAINWTMKGLVALLDSKGLTEKKEEVADTPKVDTTKTEPTQPIDKCYGVVSRLYPNYRIIDCFIRNVKHQVHVKNSKFLKLGTMIECENYGGVWKSNFKIDSRGKIHG